MGSQTEDIKEPQVLCLVKDIAMRVKEENEKFSSISPEEIIPNALFSRELTYENLHQTGLDIDYLRFAKETELAERMGLIGYKADEFIRQKLKNIINSPGKFPEAKQNILVLEIRFLFVVACTVIHQ